MKNKKRVQYIPSLVTYVDVLGFEKIVEEHSAGHISKLLRILKRMTKPWPPFTKQMKMVSQNFSDLCVRVTPLPQGTAMEKRGGHLLLEIAALTYLQEALVGQAVLLRGAMTFGQIVKSWGLVYGPALVRAYELEKKAVYPRIILDPQLFELLGAGGSDAERKFRFRGETVTRMLAKDEDGMIFVDYLRARDRPYVDYLRAHDKPYVIDGPTSPFSPRPEYLEFLRRHRQLIADGLSKHRVDKRIHSKYMWLRGYHNSVVLSRRWLSKSVAKDLMA